MCGMRIPSVRPPLEDFLSTAWTLDAFVDDVRISQHCGVQDGPIRVPDWPHNTFLVEEQQGKKDRARSIRQKSV